MLFFGSGDEASEASASSCGLKRPKSHMEMMKTVLIRWRTSTSRELDKCLCLGKVIGALLKETEINKPEYSDSGFEMMRFILRSDADKLIDHTIHPCHHHAIFPFFSEANFG